MVVSLSAASMFTLVVPWLTPPSLHLWLFVMEAVGDNASAALLSDWLGLVGDTFIWVIEH